MDVIRDVGMLPDEQLVRDHLNGDSRAFEQLFDRYRAQVFQFALRMLSNRASAEEAFQEIFLRVYQKLDRYESKQRFAAWLFTVAHHVCIDELRKFKRRRWLLFGEKFVEPMDPIDLEGEISRNQMKERVATCLERLEANQKQVFLLRIHGNLLFREIAQMLNTPLNTILARYHQAVIALKKSLQQENV
ncbi:MAG TPA: sigma-70 family RNA polymerase sigma factor [Acidobacteriota bacterium]|nr:sigma-70 family RNA polymerase sigma factor [Acidobacteriota bacterium]